MNEAQARAIFLLAGIPVTDLFQIVNHYWPDNEHYDDMRRKSPWWLVKTPAGLIKIGWRKRVITIDWYDVPVRIAALTKDQTTTWECGVHAWSYGKAVDYLRQFWTLVQYSQDATLSDEQMLELHGVSRVKAIA